jgi:hypothetical protein
MLAITRTWPPQPSQLPRSSLKNRISHCAQLIARWRSAGVRVAVGWLPLARPAGVVCAHQALWGANTPW